MPRRPKRWRCYVFWTSAKTTRPDTRGDRPHMCGDPGGLGRQEVGGPTAARGVGLESNAGEVSPPQSGRTIRLMAGSPRRHRRSKHKTNRIDLRPGSSVRGYGADWRRLRQWYGRRPPLCEDCLDRDSVTPMQEIDHVIAFTSKEDPLRLDASNLRSLCRSCHRRKHAREG